MTRTSTEKRPSRIVAAVVVSVALHLAALIVAVRTDSCASPEAPVALPTRSETVVRVVPVAREPRNEPPELLPHVALPAPDEEEVPEQPTAHDRHDRTVDRETVRLDSVPGVRAGTRAPAGRGTPEGTDEQSVGSRVPESVREDVSLRDPDGQGAGDSSGGDATRIPGVLDPSAVPSVRRGVSRAVSPDGDGLDLRGFADGIDDFASSPGARGELLEVEEGDRTALNTSRSIYWSFFEQIRGRVEREWHPMDVYRAEDSAEQRARRIDRYTVLDVTLDGDGRVTAVMVARPSGLDFLDREAVRAMRAAAPFPNVPEGLKDLNGRVSFRFGFYLRFDGSARVRRIPL